MAQIDRMNGKQGDQSKHLISNKLIWLLRNMVLNKNNVIKIVKQNIHDVYGEFQMQTHSHHDAKTNQRTKVIKDMYMLKQTG